MTYLDLMLDTFSDEVLATSSLGELGGLTRAKLYLCRGRLYSKMLNGRSAIKDWTKAIQLDPALVDARLERLHFWNDKEMKNHAKIHAECVTFLDLVHEDYSEMECYIWIPIWGHLQMQSNTTEKVSK
jgi:hypothetical protein